MGCLGARPRPVSRPLSRRKGWAVYYCYSTRAAFFRVLRPIYNTWPLKVKHVWPFNRKGSLWTWANDLRVGGKGLRDREFLPFLIFCLENKTFPSCE